MYEVVIVQRVLPHYRVEFFKKLHVKLASLGINMRLFYGKELPGSVPKSVSISVPWAHYVENNYFSFLGNELIWQKGCLGKLAGTDLVIIEQANRLLINYLIILFRRFWKYKVGFWGHGKNLQSYECFSCSELLKKKMVTSVDWWFAYTELSAQMVAEIGFPLEKITNVCNTIDTTIFSEELQSVDMLCVDKIKRELGGPRGCYCLFCGGMYALKRVDFLLSACFKIKEKVPELHVILIGDGPEKYKIENVSLRNPWIHYLGAKYGSEKAPYFVLSEALLMPGLVGLVIIDSFISSTPIFTTEIPIHSPEITYLKNGENGFMTKNDISEYVDAVVKYLNSPSIRKKVSKGCSESAKLYSIDSMVKNFTEGISACLEINS